MTTRTQLASQLPVEALVDLAEAKVDVFDLQRTLEQRGHDGCTGVLDVFKPCCMMHDALYMQRTTDRATADRLFRQCMLACAREEDNVLTRAAGSAVAWWRWLGVRVAGRAFWRDGRKA